MEARKGETPAAPQGYIAGVVCSADREWAEHASEDAEAKAFWDDFFTAQVRAVGGGVLIYEVVVRGRNT